MLTVPQVARRTGKHPETIRRWIREGRLKARKIGMQHVIEEQDLSAFLSDDDLLPVPKGWGNMWNGQPMPNWVRIIRQQRESH